MGSSSFTYDASGRRMTRTAAGVTTSFLYDGSSVLLEKQGSATTATYTYGNALVRKDGETPLFDGLGSERTVTNTAGAVQGTLTETAFGQAVASTGSSTDPYEFAATSGYRNDGDAGLSLVGARYYDAQVGVFISRDTDLSQLPYAYCNGNPVNALDPSGHNPWFTGGVGAIVAVTVFLVAAVVVEGITAGAATPFVVGAIAGGLSGAASQATTAAMDNEPIGPAAIEGGIGGAALGGIARPAKILEQAAAGGPIKE
jgi:RHS repeat-associated protein